MLHIAPPFLFPPCREPVRPFLQISGDDVEFGTMSALQRATMNGKRVLVVDDNLMDARALSSKLRSEGYEVLLAQDGAAAVSTVRKQKLHLIFLYITFPPDLAHGGGLPWAAFFIVICI